jgi:hypothetical protein
MGFYWKMAKGVTSLPRSDISYGIMQPIDDRSWAPITRNNADRPHKCVLWASDECVLRSIKDSSEIGVPLLQNHASIEIKGAR